MIRMGKSAKTKKPNKTAELQEQSPSSVLSMANTQNSSGALSESELMARDIKEGRLSGFVGSGTVLTGETTFDILLRVDGHLKGQIRSDEGTLIVGSTGRVDANIVVGEATINGAVNGDIDASNKLTLGRSARVVGNIQAPRLIIEDGAILEGSCGMIKSIEAQEQRFADSPKQFSTTELEYPNKETDEPKQLSDDTESSEESPETEPEELADAIGK